MIRPLDIYVAAGGKRPGLWRMLVGIVLIVTGWLIWTIVLMSGFVVVKIGSGLDAQQALDSLSVFMNSASSNTVLFQLATFLGVWPATWATLKLLHRQSFGTILSPEGGMRWGDFAGGLLLAIAFWVMTTILGVAVAGFPQRTGLGLDAWVIAVAPLAILVFFQASAEELVFRGYVLQQLAVRWRNPLIWGALPALLFGLAHYSSGSALGVGWHYVTVTLLFGLTAAALVWRTGSLAAAMGLHTGMNIFSLSGVGLEQVVEGTQLYLYSGADAAELLVADGIATTAVLVFILSPFCPLRARPILG